jgi:hypothetical protein
MSKMRGFYALLQFSPLPERYEFVNIGVLLVVPTERFIGVRYSQGLKRVEKLFGKQPANYFDVLKAAFEQRIKVEFSNEFSLERVEQFARSRANQMRISKLLPVAVDQPEMDLEALFDDLVGENEIVRRQPKVSVELKKKFEKAGIAMYVRKPEPVRLPEGVTIDAPYAYQNGSLNLIDPVRLSADSADALAQASKRAIEGQWLRNYSKNSSVPKKLIVVADFENQEPKFIKAMSDVMREHQVKLYEIDNCEALLEDIRVNAPKNAVSSDVLG